MADNLTVSIGADTSKLRAEIERTKLEISGLTKQARAAFQAGDTAGVNAYTDQIGKLRTNLVAVNRTLAETGAVAQTAGRSVELSARSFRTLNGALLGVGRSMGGLQGGLLGIGATFAGGAIVKGISDTVENLNKLQQTASNTTLAPATIKAFQDIMLKAGVGTDAATGALTTFSKAVFDAQLKAGQFNKTQTFGVNVMRGAEGSAVGVSNAVTTMRGALADGAVAGQKFVNVWRGGQDNTIKDLADSFGLLGINVRAFPTTPVGLTNLQIATARALQDTSRLNAALRSQLGQQLFGPDWAKITEQLVTYANSPAWSQAQKQAEQLLTPEAFAQVAAYNAAWGTLQTTLTDGIQKLTIKYFPELNAVIAAMPENVSSLFSAMDKSIQTTKEEVQGLINLYNLLANVIRGIGEALKPGFTGGSFGDPSIPPMPTTPSGSGLSFPTPILPPYAEGGMVHGPGGPTSDSVTARLSAGEFVMRAAAVQRWGPSFMSALNGMGGRMPSRGIPSFASGGLVTAAGMGGATVNLVFPGGTFSLRGDNETVGALTREARRAGMLAAGRGVGVFQ